MLETYKAKVQGNRIIWKGNPPAETRNGEEIEVEVTILSRGANREAERPYGLAKGEFVVPDDFDAPLPDDLVADFEN